MSSNRLDNWFDIDLDKRHEIVKGLTTKQFADLLEMSDEELGTPYGIFRDDPVGFISFVLGEHLWSKQREICELIAGHSKVAIPATNSCGKSFLMSRLAVWFVCVHPHDQVRVVTFAPSHRQVKDIIWNEIKAVFARNPQLQAGHSHRMNQTEWLVDELLVANGMTGGGEDETKVQGIHKPYIFVIVDEAAGIHPTVGKSFRALYTNEEAKIVAIGNPPTDEDQGFKWFEEICTDDDTDWEVMKIRAWDVPAWTGEEVPEVAKKGLTSREWIEEIRDLGPDNPWYKARLDVEFVDSIAMTMIPKEWAAMCVGKYDSSRAGPISIGIDVSGQGGDEYVVGVLDGDNFTIVYRSSGIENQDQYELAEKVYKILLEWSERLQRRIILGSLPEPVPLNVKIDGGGMGTPIADILKRFIRRDEMTGLISIKAIDFSTRAKERKRFKNVRAEMYWHMRERIRQQMAIFVPDNIASADEFVDQLSAPRMFIDEKDKRTGLESKQDMKKRGLKSPDIADTLCLASYELTYGKSYVNDVPSAGEIPFGGGGLAGSRYGMAVRPKTRYY